MTDQITNDLIISTFNSLTTIYNSLFPPDDIDPPIKFDLDISTPTDFTITSNSTDDNYLISYKFDLSDLDNPKLISSENENLDDFDDTTFDSLDKSYQHNPISILTHFFLYYFTTDHIQY